MRPRERRLATATTWFFSFCSVGSNLRRDDKFQWRVMWKEEEKRWTWAGSSDVYIYIMQKGQQREYLVRGYFSISTARASMEVVSVVFWLGSPFRYKDKPPRVGVGNFFLFNWISLDDIHVILAIAVLMMNLTLCSCWSALQHANT